MIIRKYLEQLYGLIDKQFNIDVKEYDRNLPADIRVDTLGIISNSVKSIEFELKQIDNAISLAEDMEKGLIKNG